MSRLHRMILRMLPGPFLGWLGTLMFLLLMQFLIKYLPELAGKGLSPFVILELIAYSLAYMVVLAVPMAVLLATLMAFGKLAETNTYTVIKSSGVSLVQLIWPTLIVGLVITAGMTYFNNVVLPEANFRAKNLWQDIRIKKPGFELRPGVFYDGIDGYSILVQEIPPGSNRLIDVLIYDYTEGTRRQAVIKAERGRLGTLAGGARVELTLEDGEIHRLLPPTGAFSEEQYERLRFEQHRLQLDLSDFVFERSGPRSGYRSDRTMPTQAMVQVVDSLRAGAAQDRRELHRTVTAMTQIPPDTLHAPEAPAAFLTAPVSTASATSPGDTTAAAPAQWDALSGLPEEDQRRLYSLALQNVRSVHAQIENAEREIRWKTQRANQYQVEIYKKYSIAVACLIFMLIGAPLGLSIRRGGLGTVGALALGIFMFYWVTLVQGEKLADRGYLDPWVGMWIANAVMLVVGLWLVVYISLDLRATPPLRKRLWHWLRSWRGPASSAESATYRAPARADVDVRNREVQSPKSAA